MKQQTNKHLFALYYPSLSINCSTITAGKTFTLGDRQLVHRISRVLRLRVGKELILFDRQQHAQLKIETLSPKEAQLQLATITPNIPLKPTITIGLPLLKRRDLEEAIYATTEVGVNAIQLLETTKSDHLGTKDIKLERLERIVISAAEQAKQFALPTIHKPVPLADWLTNSRFEAAVFFDPKGESLNTVADGLRSQKPKDISLLVGPEGDLTPDEKEQLHQHQFVFCALTPTVLQAHRAIALSCGAMRALL